MLLPYFSTNQSSVGQFLVGISSFQELPTCFECTPEAASCSPLLSLLQPENFNVFLTKERSGLQNVALASLLALPPLCPPVTSRVRTPQALALFLSYSFICRVSYSSDRPHTHCAAEGNLELLVPYPLLPKHWNYRHTLSCWVPSHSFLKRFFFLL